MISIDGSFGEGGGQILRTSLALSLLTGKPFRIENIRAGRKKPGLLRQHLTALRAATEIGDAKVTGDSIGSRELIFEPHAVKPGQYHFAVGTAGSATLVLQTVLPALMLAKGRSELVLEGGTHNPYAPPFDFLVNAFLPIVNRMGPKISATLDRPGFYPAGGGKFSVSIEPAKTLSRVDLPKRGGIRSQRARAVVSKLPIRIAEDELNILRAKLSWEKDCLKSEEVTDSAGPGNIIVATVECDHVTEVFTGFGEKGVKLGAVADKVVQDIREYLVADVPVGRHLADQLLIPMALAGGGRFRTLPLTRHSTTNIDVLKKFLEIDVAVSNISKDVCEIVIEKR